MGPSDITFVGLAALYGGLASLAIVGGLWLCAKPQPWRYFLFLCTALSFLFLTQHPFPAPGTLHCPVRSATPQLVPFHYVETLVRLGQKNATALDYLGNRLLWASGMNFLICGVIGGTLVRHMQAWGGIILFAAMLTLTIELTQLTGIWGYFPCAYRQFNVDDLMLNFLGVLCGAWVMKRWNAGPH